MSFLDFLELTPTTATTREEAVARVLADVGDGAEAVKVEALSQRGRPMELLSVEVRVPGQEKTELHFVFVRREVSA